MEGEEYEAPEAETSLAELRERILQDPNYLQELMQELQAVNPQLYQAMQQDPQGALQTLLGEHEAEMEDEEQPEPDIQITEEEKAAIDRLAGLGFTEMQAAQTLFACEKNEMLAANFLLENSASLRAEVEEDLPELAPPAAPEAKTEVKKENKKEGKQ
eukprot:TRINITY_DN12523_c0_g2_i5.p2 TRINITY_DN12523_c0_g2~~TRINITY_DN12523_c0_g2_i5.p2  ORF type:complete len:158 (-),score=62.60 TRINITY_DN12523_c0_g2_i5:108-581(-)